MYKKKIRIKVKKSKRSGHTPHRSGSGIHQDRRLKRLKTRKNLENKAIKEFE